MNRGDEMAAHIEAGERQSASGGAGPDDKSDQQLHTILENIGRAAHQDKLHSGFTSGLDLDALERKPNDRLGVVKNQMQKRRSGAFARFLLAISIGVAATLAWQSYGDEAKQMFAAKAPELGWSPDTKQMIANWVEQLGWTKSRQAAPVLQNAPAAVAPSVPAGPSIRLRGIASNSDGCSRAAANGGADRRRSRPDGAEDV